jgi:hypothetical protein
MAKKVHTTILIKLDPKTGKIRLDPGVDDECHDPALPVEMSRACGWTLFMVHWASVPSDLDWSIEFGKVSPFVSGAHTFRNRPGQRGGKIRHWDDQPVDEYKYSITYRFKGKTHVVDPKIVIQDSGPFIPTTLREVADRLRELSERTAEIASETAELESIVESMVTESAKKTARQARPRKR